MGAVGMPWRDSLVGIACTEEQLLLKGAPNELEANWQIFTEAAWYDEGWDTGQIDRQRTDITQVHREWVIKF